MNKEDRVFLAKAAKAVELWIEENDLSILDIADATGKSPETIRKWRSQHHQSVPSLLDLLRVNASLDADKYRLMPCSAACEAFDSLPEDVKGSLGWLVTHATKGMK